MVYAEGRPEAAEGPLQLQGPLQLRAPACTQGHEESSALEEGVDVDARDADELQEIAALQREIAEQEALLDEHQTALVRAGESVL